MKKLYKSNKDRMISGVCGGVAEYLNVDPTIVRLIWVLLSFGAGTGIIAYIVCAIVLPTAPADRPYYHDSDNDYDPNQGNGPPR